MAQALKVLVTGPITSLEAYTNKLTQLQSKHSFSLVVAQDLFSRLDPAKADEEVQKLVNGEYKLPVQVYATYGMGKLPPKVQEKVEKGEEVCPNLNVLPQAGVLSLASGLRIATLSGTSPEAAAAAASSEDQAAPAVEPFTASQVSDLISSLSPTPQSSSSALPPPPAPKPVDLLLTHLCPSSLSLLSAKPLTPPESRAPEPVFSKELDEVARVARAKYHFVDAPGVFWEREPFEWPVQEGEAPQKSYCRALSLGEMGNKTKDRWFYAFSITPGQPSAAPPSSTPSPLHPLRLAEAGALAATLNGTNGPRGLKRPAAAAVDANDVNEMGIPNYIFQGQAGGGDRQGKKGKGGPPPEHYTCNICQQKGHWIQDCPEKEARDAERDAARKAGGHRGPAKPISPDECWFCLSNPKVTKHLITSIGTETYVTLPKGQVCSTDSSPVPGGGHVLIIPIAHYPTLRTIPTDLAPPVLEEVALYKEALRKCYKSFGAEMVAFEVARSTGKGGHAHVQICPIPASLASQAEKVFLEQGHKFNYAFEEVSDPSTFHSRAAGDDAEGKERTEYFKVDLPGGKSLVHWINAGTPFSLQFGRETLAALLHAPDRADWKRCAKPDAEEKKDAQRFKQAFKSFDPST
ncbi:hypothetical protein JCM10908_004366 [Rhodotorula pacifica]|uniref:Drn1p n=1 Tax=Rhodotorula pacifica TaxID=1495444 RepID=UPI00316EFD0E